MELSHEICIKVVYDDVHLVELETSFSTKGWCGYATAYTQFPTIIEFVEQLTLFAQSLQGEVSFEIGSDNGIGYVKMRFYPLDQAGHLACHLYMSPQVPTQHRPEEVTQIAIELYTEPSAIDDFIIGLKQLTVSKRGSAILKIR